MHRRELLQALVIGLLSLGGIARAQDGPARKRPLRRRPKHATPSTPAAPKAQPVRAPTVPKSPAGGPVRPATRPMLRAPMPRATAAPTRSASGSTGSGSPGAALDPAKQRSAKIVVVGDPAVGKTSLLIRYDTGRFPTEVIPTVFDNFAKEVVHARVPWQLSTWDTAGQEDYDRLRPLSYPQTDLFIVAVAADRTHALDNVKAKWLPEIQHHVPNARVLLVGCKADLRDSPDPSRPMLRREDAQAFAQQVRDRFHVVGYQECSAKTGRGVDAVFETALGAIATEAQGA